MYLTGTYNLLLLLKTVIYAHTSPPPQLLTHTAPFITSSLSLSLTHLTRTNIPCSRPPKHTNAPHTPHQYKHIHTCTSPITYTPPIHIHPPHPSHTHTDLAYTPHPSHRHLSTSTCTPHPPHPLHSFLSCTPHTSLSFLSCTPHSFASKCLTGTPESYTCACACMHAHTHKYWSNYNCFKHFSSVSFMRTRMASSSQMMCVELPSTWIRVSSLGWKWQWRIGDYL